MKYRLNRLIQNGAILLALMLPLAAQVNSAWALFDDELVTQGLEGAPETRQIAPTISADLKTLSEKLAALQSELKRFGITRVYIGGGSAPAILDHVYFGKPLDMRDLDIFTIPGRKVTHEEAVEIARVLQAAGFGSFDPDKDVTTISRGDPSKGFGGSSEVAEIAQLKSGDSDLDVKFYYSEEHLRLNGLVDTDTIMIPLDSGTTLEGFVKKNLFDTPPDRLGRLKITDDIHDGYVSWMKRQPKIIHWTEIERDPWVQSFRIARNFVKLDRFEVPPDTSKRLSQLVAGSTRADHPTILKNIIRLLADTSRVKELRLVQSFGTLKAWFPGLDERLRSLSDEQLEHLLSAPPTTELKLEALLKLAPPESLLALFEDPKVQQAYPKLTQSIRVDSAKRILSEHFPASEVAKLDFEGASESFYKKLIQVSSNKSLTPDEAKVLLVRELILSQPANRTRTIAALRSFVSESILTQAIHESTLVTYLTSSQMSCVIKGFGADLHSPPQ